jgi:hypothetical protein
MNSRVSGFIPGRAGDYIMVHVSREGQPYRK